jgi:hypothetical protein
VADGVFVPDDAGRVRFHETGAPSREALERIVRRMRDRTLRGELVGEGIVSPDGECCIMVH